MLKWSGSRCQSLPFHCDAAKSLPTPSTLECEGISKVKGLEVATVVRPMWTELLSVSGISGEVLLHRQLTMANAPTPLVLITPVLGEPYIGQTLGGMYRVLGKLNEGGMGTVYLADNVSLPGQRTVVKVMQAQTDDDKEILRREAKQLVNIRHPTVVSVLAFGEEKDFQYLAMEYLEGQTLEQILVKYRQLGVLESLRIGLRIADALHACHEQGLVHRDLKPANVMVKLAKDATKFVDWLKLIDFGLTLKTGEKSEAAMGTPQYIAPEQALNEATGPQTDIYALGVILFEMLTGQLPYTENDTVALLQAHLSKRIPRVRELAPYVDEEVDALVYDFMQKDKSKRPETSALAAKRLARLERQYAEQATNLRRAAEAEEAETTSTSVTRLASIADVHGTAGGVASANSAKSTHAPTVVIDETLRQGPRHTDEALSDAGLHRRDSKVWLLAGLGLLIVALGLGLVWLMREAPKTANAGEPLAEVPKAEAAPKAEAVKPSEGVAGPAQLPAATAVAPVAAETVKAPTAEVKAPTVPEEPPLPKITMVAKRVPLPNAAEAKPKVAVVIKQPTPASSQVKIEQEVCDQSAGWKTRLNLTLSNLEVVASKLGSDKFAKFSLESEAASAMIERAESNSDCVRAREAVTQLQQKYRP
jgi:serine/threonine protein kinase